MQKNTSLYKEPGGILDEIVRVKHIEVTESRQKLPVTRLEESELFGRKCYSLREFLLAPERTGIIAEFKRASPSKGAINNKAEVSAVTRQYAAAGASALSVLTDYQFFGGSIRDLVEARAANTIPILRKEFILDEYQIIEAKAIGADVILLIAAILQPPTIVKFANLAKSIGLNVLLEVHNLTELKESICDYVDAIGVNNRNLSDFSVDVQHSFNLVDEIPAGFLKISESGISDPGVINDLKKAGFHGFLIGENFMKTENPGTAMKNFVHTLKETEY